MPPEARIDAPGALHHIIVRDADVARRLTISPNTVSMAVSREPKLEDIKPIQKPLSGIR